MKKIIVSLFLLVVALSSSAVANSSKVSFLGAAMDVNQVFRPATM